MNAGRLIILRVASLLFSGAQLEMLYRRLARVWLSMLLKDEFAHDEAREEGRRAVAFVTIFCYRFAALVIL